MIRNDNYNLLYFIFKRLLKSLLALVIITLVVFYISTKSQINPIKNKINLLFSSRNISVFEKEKIIDEFVKNSYTNLPLFYFSVEPSFFNDSIFKLYNPKEKQFVERLQYQFQNWNYSILYYQALKQLTVQASTNDSLTQQSINNMHAIIDFRTPEEFKRLTYQLLNFAPSDCPFFKKHQPQLKEMLYTENTLQLQKNSSAYFIPSIHFYKNNQFHNWLFGNQDGKGLLHGNFGTSIHSGESNNQIIIRNLKWSLFFSIISICIALSVSVIIGLGIANLKKIKRYELSKKSLLLLFSIPNFCVCILLVTIFSSNQFFNILPSSGLTFNFTNSPNASVLEIIPHIILPLICYSYSSVIFLTQYISTIARKEFDNDYVRTAYAKGATEFTVLWKHVLKNCLVPIFQIIGLLFPYLVGGSVIVETFFTLPGLGYQTINAILNYDYSLLSALVFISSAFTLCMYLLTDILIALVDKRIILNEDI